MELSEKVCYNYSIQLQRRNNADNTVRRLTRRKVNFRMATPNSIPDSPHNQTEEWRDIPGYEGLYQVSDQGRIKRLPQSRILTPTQYSSGYLYIKLSKQGIVHRFLVHRLVLLVFIGDSPDLQANHKNGNKLDNRVSNLEYVTARENIRHAWANGLAAAARGEAHSGSKLTDSDVIEIRQLGASGLSQQSIANRFGINQTMVGNILRRKNWRHLP